MGQLTLSTYQSTRGNFISLYLAGFQPNAPYKFTVRHVQSAQKIADYDYTTKADGSDRRSFHVDTDAPTGRYRVSFMYEGQTTSSTVEFTVI